MKNKNKSANELVDLILEFRKKQDPTSSGHAYASEALIALLEWARTSSPNGLQKVINSNYSFYESELKDIQSVANKASLEDLYYA